MTEELLEESHQKVFDQYYWSYRRWFGPRIQAAYCEQIKEALELIQGHPGSAVLEVGCGLGIESLWLAMNGASITAIDVVRHCIDAARSRQKIISTPRTA